ncbi:hypothetical protein SPRG_02850 [Saprolegnia parasitica CBS 223.65]|uniref:Uncharacterized protein n=1 Tax=Saprolegnia parasitica (strain CBS 223.65) TaxID=695850 RepID=A0A067CPE5_SAPPC|nr:hypothetical protein SPRG_02850 [Saprolegnia parasitica CBS 223.65]KDO32373.1 hypothetical protein SPRG_02850 [Saprolegnia parasitica CBS 223.65]|eukprot:XP_012196827.1 hypothetical protein SPRG_02850 [Saprolegnia parasitica CBS 223.65]
MHVSQQPVIAFQVTRCLASAYDVRHFLLALSATALDDSLRALLQLLETVAPSLVWPQVHCGALPASARGLLQTALPVISILRIPQFWPHRLLLPPTMLVVVDDTSHGSPLANHVGHDASRLGSSLTEYAAYIIDVTLFMPLGETTALCAALRACCNVRRANLLWEEVDQAALDALMAMMTLSWPHLKTLQLGSERRSERSWIDDAGSVCRWLAVARVSSITFQAIEFLSRTASIVVDALLTSPTLVALQLMNAVSLTILLANGRATPDRLTTLQIRLPRYPVGGFVAKWAAKLRGARALRELVIEGEMPSMLQALATVDSLRCLQHLTISSDVDDLPSSLDRLRHLRFVNCTLAPMALTSLVTILQSTSSLQTLGLDHASLTPSQLDALCSVLPQWLGRCGTVLDLTGNDVGEAASWRRSSHYALSGSKSPLRWKLLARGLVRVLSLASTITQMHCPHAVTIHLRSNGLSHLARRACVMALALSKNVMLDLQDNKDATSRGDETSGDDDDQDITALATSLGLQSLAPDVFTS